MQQKKNQYERDLIQFSFTVHKLRNGQIYKPLSIAIFIDSKIVQSGNPSKNAFYNSNSTTQKSLPYNEGGSIKKFIHTTKS